MRFSSIPFQLGDLRHGLFQRDLDFGQRRDRHPDRQVIIQHVIFAQIGVGQHEIPKRLRVAQPAQWPTISHACGRSTAMWSVAVLALDGPTPMLTSVIPTRLRVSGDRSASAAAFEGAVPSPSVISALPVTQSWYTAVGISQLRAGIGLEFGHIELVVGEQHVVLEMRGSVAV